MKIAIIGAGLPRHRHLNIAIVGGGFTGLTAAYELVKHGHQVTVFEKEKQAGGMAGGFKLPDWQWPLETSYHHFFTNDTAFLSLINELGLDDDLIIKRPITATLFQSLENNVSSVNEKNYDARFSRLAKQTPVQAKQSIARSGANNFFCEQQSSREQIYQLDSPMNLLSFPLLTPLDKLRTVSLLAFCKLNPFWQPLENISAKDFFLKWGGRKSWELIWDPLMVGKFGKYANEVSASWLWARINKRTQQLGYLRGGFQHLADTLAKVITSRGGKILTKTPVINISFARPGLAKLNTMTKHFEFDRVLLTIPSPLARQITHNLQPTTHKHTHYLHAQVLILETKEPILKDIYWLNINDRSFPFIVVVGHTNLIDKKHYGGNHITYIGNYLTDNHPYLSLTKQQLLNKFLPYIKKINPNIYSALCIINYKLVTIPYAQPIHTLHYAKQIKPIQTNIPGLFLANQDNVFPWDRAVNYTIELGQKTAAIMK